MAILPLLVTSKKNGATLYQSDSEQSSKKIELEKLLLVDNSTLISKLIFLVTIQHIINKKPVVAYFFDFDCLNEVSSQSRKNK